MKHGSNEHSNGTSRHRCRITLGEVTEIAIQQAPPAVKFVYLDIGSVDREAKHFKNLKVLSPSDAPSRARQIVKPGDVLVSMTRPNLNAVAMVPDRGDYFVASTGFHVLRSRWVDPKYLLYLVQSGSFVEAMSALVQGALYPAIRPRDIAGFEFDLPPQREQTRIVEKLEELLSELDAGMAEVKTAQRKLAKYHQSLLKAAEEGALTADWRAARARSREPQESGADLLQRILTERRARWEVKQSTKYAEQGRTPPKDWRAKYPEPVAPDIAELPRLPEGWVWATLDQCAIDEDGITDGPFGSSLKSEHYTESGPRVIRLQNIGEGRFLDARAHISEERYELLRKHAVIEGDVVVAMLGEVLPRSCVIPGEVAPAIVKADCARIRLNPELISPKLVAAALNSESTRKRVNRFVKGIGRPRVNLGHVRSIPVPLPPRAEQDRMLDVLSERLESYDSQNSAIDRGVSLLTAQRRNILKAAFAGQLVPQDPNDEPASVLLERIHAERTPMGQTTPRKRSRKIREQR